MLRLPEFEYRVARDLDEVSGTLADEGPGIRVVAGGTDLWPNMKRRHQSARKVLSLMRIEELRGIADSGSGGELRLGATTILDPIARHPGVRARYPALARAVSAISSPPLRKMGTIGGNLCLDTRCTYYNQTEEWRRSIDYCMKEAGTICWVAPSSPRCWAHSASDAAPMLIALDARVRVVSREGDRTLPLSDLYRDDGIDYLGLQPGELLTDVLVPASSGAGSCSSSFWKLRRRGSIDFAVLSVAAAVWLGDDGEVARSRIVLGAVGSRPVEVPEAARALRGSRLTPDTIAEAGELARKAATPMDNTDFQAQWRGVMAARYTGAALREIAGLDPGLAPPNHLPMT